MAQKVTENFDNFLYVLIIRVVWVMKNNIFLRILMISQHYGYSILKHYMVFIFNKYTKFGPCR